MSIRIVPRKTVGVHVVVCDHCNKPIKNAEDGNAVWEQAGKMASPPVLHVHKKCWRAYRDANPDSGCEDLQVHLLLLTRGLKFKPEKAKKLITLRVDLD